MGNRIADDVFSVACGVPAAGKTLDRGDTVAATEALDRRTALLPRHATPLTQSRRIRLVGFAPKARLAGYGPPNPAMQTPPYKTTLGEPYPLGAIPSKDGVNFSLFAQHATSVQLLLFESYSDSIPQQVVNLHPVLNKTFHYWHVFVEGVSPGQLYAYRLGGPCDLSQGFRYNQNKVLLDPYSRGVVYGRNWRRDLACDGSDNCQSVMKSLVVDARHLRLGGRGRTRPSPFRLRDL